MLTEQTLWQVKKGKTNLNFIFKPHPKRTWKLGKRKNKKRYLPSMRLHTSLKVPDEPVT